MYFLTVNSKSIGGAKGLNKASSIFEKYLDGVKLVPESGCFGKGYVQLVYRVQLSEVPIVMAACAEDTSHEYRFSFEIMPASGSDLPE